MFAVTQTTGTRALWYLTRSTGLVSMVLLTISLALGVVEVQQWETRSAPRYLTAALHKNVSLVVMAFLAIHIVTAVLDSYAPIHWLDVVVPLHSAYRPVWLGLGAVAIDLLLALVVTSLLRGRLGYRTWKAVHWSAYACWPVALAHGLGTGSDSARNWVIGLNAACVALVLAAVWWRLSTEWRSNTGRRLAGMVTSVVAVVALIGWMATGPTQRGWARKAGTPTNLLGGGSSSTSSWPGGH